MGWRDDKDLGPWDFIKQSNKSYYNEGNHIASYESPIWTSVFTGIPVTPVHVPCGYWTTEKPPEKCDSNYPLYWDTDISPETILPDDSATVAFIVGSDIICEGLFSWIVSGPDFTLAAAQTSGLQNTLIAGPNSCGLASIFVTDVYGNSTVGYVRSSEGTWALDTLNSGSFNPACIVADIAEKVIDIEIEGGIRIEHQTWRFCCTNDNAGPHSALNCELSIVTVPCGHPSWYPHIVCWVYRKDIWECE